MTTTIQDIFIEGDDSQNVIGNTVDGDLVIKHIRNIRGRPSMFLSEKEVDDCVKVYVPALNHDRIVGALAHDTAVALCGPTGAGIGITAIAALRHLHPGLRIQRFSAGEDDVEQVAERARTHGYLVRARDEDPSRLRSFLEAARLSGSLAVVVGTTAELRRFNDFMKILSVEPPRADEVYTRHLAVRGLGDTGWPYWQRGRELLKGASPSDARRLASLVDEITREGGGERDVESAYLEWAEELGDWFRNHRGALLDQTLMIAAAAIAPADESQVYGAALLLARRLDVTPIGGGGGLAWTPTRGLRRLLEAEGDGDRIIFARHGYGESVLHHVWAEYSLAQLELLSWLSDLPTDGVLALETPLAHRLVGLFAKLAARYNKGEKITQTARTWAEKNRSDLAYIALAETCLDPVVGGQVRSKLYEWSRQRQASQTLKLTIARVCEALGQTYLPIALTRLKHLATHGNRQVGQEVLEVTRSLAKLNPRAVYTAALNWAGTAVDLPPREGARRLDVAIPLLLDLLPRFGDIETGRVLESLGRLVTNGHSGLHSRLRAWAMNLAADHNVPILPLALALASADEGTTTTNAGRAFGTDLFLSLILAYGPHDLPKILGSLPAGVLRSCAVPWRLALGGRPHGLPRFEEALSLWLNTAADHEDLRPPLVSALVVAARHDPPRRQRLTALAGTWAAGIRRRRTVKEDILTRVLLPEWHRWSLILWVRLRRALSTGP